MNLTELSIDRSTKPRETGGEILTKRAPGELAGRNEARSRNHRKAPCPAESGRGTRQNSLPFLRCDVLLTAPASDGRMSVIATTEVALTHLRKSLNELRRIASHRTDFRQDPSPGSGPSLSGRWFREDAPARVCMAGNPSALLLPERAGPDFRPDCSGQGPNPSSGNASPWESGTSPDGPDPPDDGLQVERSPVHARPLSLQKK